MAAQVETMFSVREKPWHGLGTVVTYAPTSENALRLAGLDWRVEQQEAYTQDNFIIPGYKVNVRDKDLAVLGIVSDRYRVVQNEEAFAFTDDLLDEGVQYETAGSLQGGRKVWILAKMPEKYEILGDEIEPYFLLMNSHDGSSGFTVAMTPVRVVCSNTLNLALKEAKRIWTSRHTTNVLSRMAEAQETFIKVRSYMDALDGEIERLAEKKLSGKTVMRLLEEFFPQDGDLSDIQRSNNKRQLDDLKMRYFDAPDLRDMGHNGYRLINAVSDFATHREPSRRTCNFKENRMLRIVGGNRMIDRAYRMVQAA